MRIIDKVITSYTSRSGGIGRRSGLKIRRRQKRVGSSPTFGRKNNLSFDWLFFYVWESNRRSRKMRP